MLSLGKFPSQPQCNNVILHNSTSKTFLFPTKMPLTPFFSTSSSNRIVHLGCWRKRTGFCTYASKSERKGGNDMLEIDDIEDFDEDDDFFEEGEDEDLGKGEGDEDDEVFIPLNNMKKWLRNKPRGFGEGKVYDTSIEDKLMEEIEQSRRAQLANINKLKNNPVQPNAKKEALQQEKVSEECKDGFQVRLVNLPKKKNIHRDLQFAFKGVPGIVDIVPVVSGNKRTRDPICKGLAFISLRSENDAYRFLQNFSGTSIMFGKVLKQIKCEMTTGLLEPGYEQFAEETSYNAQLAVSSTEDVSIELENQDEMHKSTQAEDDREDLETQRQLESKWDGDPETKEESIVKSSYSLKKKGEVQEKKKTVASKQKKEKILKFSIPGSANRLKIREKEVLTGVFSKYGTNASLATREQS